MEKIKYHWKKKHIAHIRASTPRDTHEFAFIMEEMGLELDFEIENFEEVIEGESISSSGGPESDIDAGEIWEYDDESQAAGGVVATGALAYRHEP